MGVIGSIVGGIFGIGAAHKAANAQASASGQAANLSQQALDFQKQEWATQQANIAPWLKAGGAAETELSSLLGTPGQGLLTPFQAPTSVTEQNDPGYQFRLQQGAQALQNSAAARGGLLSGNTAKALEDYSQNYASNEYQNVYNRAFNTFETNQANTFNRLSALAGGGQVAAATLGQEGQAAAGNVGYLAGQQGGFLQNQGAARASGYIGANNQLQNMFGNIQGNLLLSSLLGGG